MQNFFLNLVNLLSTLPWIHPGEQTEIYKALNNFPSVLEPQLEYFDSWSKENPWKNVWTAYPENSRQIVQVVNWAKNFSWQVRASGLMHNWSPLSLPPGDFHSSNTWAKEGGRKPPVIFKKINSKSDGRNLRLILLKTRKLNKMGIISNTPGDFSFWAEPGVLMEDLLTFLEKWNMGILNFPAPGEITLGGALTIGAHGTSIPSLNETRRPKVKGHTFGGLSNLIMSMTIVAYNQNLDEYQLKTLSRSDPEISPFLVSLGRTFIVNVTMRAGPLQYFRCENLMDIPAQELFSHPNRSENLTNRRPKNGSHTVRTISKYLDESGRIEVILFPRTKNVWLKVWTLIEDEPGTGTGCPPAPRPPLPFPLNLFEPKNVNQPYSYNFAHDLNPFFASQVRKMHENPKHLYKPYRNILGPFSYAYSKFEILRDQNVEFCGSSKNVFLYVGAKTLRYHENGHALICKRSDVQLVINQLYQIQQNLTSQYDKRGMSPINGPMTFRITGLDDPTDVGVSGAESPMISSSHPVPQRPELDTVIWFNILTFPQTPHAYEFYRDLEKEFIRIFDGTLAVLRPEWSKGWAYTERGPWKDKDFLEKFIPRSFAKWQEFRRILHQNDPFNIFTNEFLLKSLMT